MFRFSKFFLIWYILRLPTKLTHFRQKIWTFLGCTKVAVFSHHITGKRAWQDTLFFTYYVFETKLLLRPQDHSVPIILDHIIYI